MGNASSGALSISVIDYIALLLIIFSKSITRFVQTFAPRILPVYRG